MDHGEGTQIEIVIERATLNVELKQKRQEEIGNLNIFYFYFCLRYLKLPTKVRRFFLHPKNTHTVIRNKKGAD